ncbi:MAG: hypothetical protein U0821_23965 [Chloroflexota bacterium]
MLMFVMCVAAPPIIGYIRGSSPQAIRFTEILLIVFALPWMTLIMVAQEIIERHPRPVPPRPGRDS